MSDWPPLLPDHVLVERWREASRPIVDMLDSIGLEADAITCVATNVETGKREHVLHMRPRGARSSQEAPDCIDPLERRARRAIEAMRGRWTASARVDGRVLRHELERLIPGAVLLETRGRARALRAFARTPQRGKQKAGWRSMYVFSIDDVRRFAEGARR